MFNFLDIFTFKISWIFRTKIPLSVMDSWRKNVALGKIIHTYEAPLMLERENAFNENLFSI